MGTRLARLAWDPAAPAGAGGARRVRGGVARAEGRRRPHRAAGQARRERGGPAAGRPGVRPGSAGETRAGDGLTEGRLRWAGAAGPAGRLRVRRRRRRRRRARMPLSRPRPALPGGWNAGFRGSAAANVKFLGSLGRATNKR